MSKTDAAQGEPPSEAQDAAGEPRRALGRRLLVLRIAAAGSAAVAAAPAAQALEPTPVQYRTGLTDADPGDGPGYGRGGYRGRGVTDNDPGDAPGRGRGWR